MLVTILIFVIGILALYFSSLLIGQQEKLKTTGVEVFYYEVEDTHNSSQSGDTIEIQTGNDLRVQEIKPLSPMDGEKGK